MFMLFSLMVILKKKKLFGFNERSAQNIFLKIVLKDINNLVISN